MTSAFDTDNAVTARTLMIHELSEALPGQSFARPERPEDVWADLLGAVRSAGNVVNAYDPKALQRLNAEVVAAREVVYAAQGLGAIVAGEELTQAIVAYERTLVP